MRTPLLLVACAASISACATLRAPLGGHTWNGVCYGALSQDVRHLAGEDAYDCGMLHLNPPDGAGAQLMACAQHVVASGAAFRFGYEGAGDDSRFCSVAVRDASGQLYALSVDQDVTGQWGLHGDHSAMSVRRCSSIDFIPGAIGPNSFFSLSRCEGAQDVVDRLASQRKTP